MRGKLRESLNPCFNIENRSKTNTALMQQFTHFRGIVQITGRVY